MFSLPIFNQLNQARNILIAGAGGGFDIFSGLPLFFSLKRQGKSVYLANWTFSDMFASPDGPLKLNEYLFEVDAKSAGDYYFPERYLCEWLRTKNFDNKIYCFKRCGTSQLKESYNTLVDKFKIDTILLVDGGTDSLLRGVEADLGTPDEDMTSIAAVSQIEVERKILASIGFGVDAFHGVCHSHVLSMIAEQIKREGYLGAFSLMNTMEEVKLFSSAAKYVFRKMPEATSIVVSSIISALEGEFGDYQVTERTEGSKLFINPLMSLYWFFQLDTIADSIVYMDELKEAKNIYDVMATIRSRNVPVKKPWENLPI